ncbi:MAG: tRNA (guanosine(37)-N1)-methyltransferase TrmD [Candidatus Omnitrophota bacterium]|jgi:tRNA (guanine37-N1)-methyltransferase
MKIDIITIFPGMFEPVLNESIIKRAQAKGKITIAVHDLREYSRDKHKKIDDRPFGGGAGMVMCPEPIFKALRCLKSRTTRVILLSPQGRRLNQGIAKEFAKEKHLILICGHYEGIDERVRIHLVDDEISIGDFVLTGGELPAMVFVDCLTRLIPGVLGDKNSLKFESFEGNLLEYPHYTRPARYAGMSVPKVLLSGDHKAIAVWRHLHAVKNTEEKRPDLLPHVKTKKKGVTHG